MIRLKLVKIEKVKQTSSSFLFHTERTSRYIEQVFSTYLVHILSWVDSFLPIRTQSENLKKKREILTYTKQSQQKDRRRTKFWHIDLLFQFSYVSHPMLFKYCCCCFLDFLSKLTFVFKVSLPGLIRFMCVCDQYYYLL